MDKWRRQQILIPFVSLWLVLVGMQAALYTALDVEMQYTMKIVLLYGIVALVLLILAFFRRKWSMIGMFAVMAGMGIYLWKMWERIFVDAKILAYYINRQYMAYTNQTLLLQKWCVEDALDNNTVLIMLCIVFGMYIAFVAFRFFSKFYGYIPVIFIYCGALLLGRAPERIPAILLIIGIALGMMWISEQQQVCTGLQVRRKRGASGKRYVLTVLILITGITVAWYLTEQVSDTVFQNVGRIQSRQHKVELSLRKKADEVGQYVRGMLGVDSGGILSNASPQYRDKMVMEVTIEEKPSLSLYLRGFVGDIYHKGKWRASDQIESTKDTLIREGNQTLWKGKYRFSSYTSLYQKEGNMTIRYTNFGRRSKYVYTPYGDADPEDELSIIEKRTCQGREDDFLELYTKLALEWSGSFVKMSDESVRKVQQILWNNTEYSLDLDPVPYDQDYAEYFLFVSQKGYCEHYATAGTLLLRSMDLCARYATGYRITPDQFKENEDGTYTAQVLDSDAHAWSEVWVEKSGAWLPQEMTPGSAMEEQVVPREMASNRTAAPVETEAQNQAIDFASSKNTEEPSPEITAQADPGVSSGEEEKPGSEPGGKETSDHAPESIYDRLAKLPMALRIGVGIGFILISFVLVILIFRYCRKRRQRKRLEQMRRRNPKYYVGLRLAVWLDDLKRTGLAVHAKMPEQQWFQMIADAFGDRIAEQEHIMLLDLVRKAAYSAEPISKEEIQWMDQYCKKIEGFAVRKK